MFVACKVAKIDIRIILLYTKWRFIDIYIHKRKSIQLYHVSILEYASVGDIEQIYIATLSKVDDYLARLSFLGQSPRNETWCLFVLKP